jgi:hypothetical protein
VHATTKAGMWWGGVGRGGGGGQRDWQSINGNKSMLVLSGEVVSSYELGVVIPLSILDLDVANIKMINLKYCFQIKRVTTHMRPESKAAGIDAQLAGLTFKPIGCAIMVLIFDNI